MNERIRWIRNNLKSQNIQGMIISNPINIKYLTNIEAEGTLLLTLRENIYITDDRYIENVKRTLTIEDDIVVTNIKDLSLEDYENFFMFCEVVGFEEEYVTYAKYKEFMRKYKIHELVETEGIVEKQRQIKDEEEISYLRKSCEITDNCFLHLLEYIKIGMTEKEIAYEVEKYFKENGAEGTSFETIVASGANSSVPHWVPADREIADGDIIIIDMGCKYNGYCSDMTRTIFIGNITEYAKDVYDLVLKNQKLALSEMKERCKH
ncbi:MAG: aminopeptidase P family protein [Clostridia bacterium]|nr:aminopeptidase P family protein [Clostridia bacterium]